MECPQCGSEFVPRRRWPWEGQWCSFTCWRRMIVELRELSLTVSRWSAALEMPEVVNARDTVAARCAQATLAPRPEPPEPELPPEGDDESDLPVYVTF